MIKNIPEAIKFSRQGDSLETYFESVLSYFVKEKKKIKTWKEFGIIPSIEI